jgi:AsmA-like C-terminal region
VAKADRAAISTQSRNLASAAGRAFQHHWWKILIAAVAVVAIAIVLLTLYFPFSEKRVTASLRETFPSNISMDHFERVYFPHPGCTAEGVIFRLASSALDAPPVVTIQRLTIQGTYANLLLRPHHISKAFLEGLRVRIPVLGHASKPPNKRTNSRTTVGEVIANGAILEVARSNNKPTLRFEIHKLSLGSVGAKTQMSYQVTLRNAEPPGEITSAGHVGPLNADRPGQTAVSGTYSFHQADLSAFQGVAGILASEGKFSGPLGRIDVQGTTDVPNFQVVRTSHIGNLRTRFHALVDGLNGDVALTNVDASYEGTKFKTSGQIVHKEGSPGKLTSLDFAVRDGRIQDLLQIFVRERPPMSGKTSFEARVTVPPEGEPFLKEVTLDGDFAIGDGRFENPSTQRRANELSETARGLKKDKKDNEENDPANNVASNLQGHVTLRNGVATFPTVEFTVPGADAQMHGTYNVLNDKIDFHGTVKMDAKFSQSTSGIKSLLAKVLDPLFNNKHGAGSIVPVVVDGTYDNPHFGVDLNPTQK